MLGLVIMITCSLSAAVYINLTASKAVAQLKRNTIYVSGGRKDTRVGSKFQGLIAGVVVTQVLALLCYSTHCWICKREERSKDEHQKRLKGRHSAEA